MEADNQLGFTSGETLSYSLFDVAVRRPSGSNGFRKLHLCYNDVGVSEFKSVSITWGDGPQRAWVKALEAEDVIQLIPSAFYRAWVNVIKEAHIKIEYEMGIDATHVPGAPLALENSAYCTLPLENASRDIRLLELDPGQYEDELSGKFLLHHLIDDHGGSDKGFHTLSYCWGRGQERAHVALQLPTTGQDMVAPTQWFSIQKEVYKALKRIRRRNETIRIWVDALCINQEDHDERTHQVNIMGEIYSRADVVHIWLGEDDPAVKSAIGFIHDAYNYNEGSCPGAAACTCSPTRHSIDVSTFKGSNSRDTGSSYKDLRELFSVHRQTIQADVLASLGIHKDRSYRVILNELTCYFFSRPWFGRVWVLQEALLARQAIMHCGQEEIDWKEVVTVNSYLSHEQFRRQTPHEGPQTCMPRVWASLIGRKALRNSEGPESLKRQLPILDILLQSLDMKATDARDKLYAVLSFAKEASPGNDVPLSLRPNYHETNSVKCVFAMLNKWHIHNYQSLAILSAVHYQPTRTWQRTLCDVDARINDAPPMPSWSFGVEGDSKWLNANLESQFNFRAGGNTVPDRQLLTLNSDEPYLLSLRGVRLATINVITKFPIGLDEEYEYDGRDTSQNELVSVFGRIFDPVGAYGFWNWISCPMGDQDPATRVSKFTVHWASHWNHAEKPRRLRAHEPHWTTLDCVDDCFFQASHGFQGLCPWAARPGDLIVLLYGGNVPFLLRKVAGHEAGGRFHLVGECYVHDAGVMGGDYLDSLTGNGLAAQEESMAETFVLE
ncbi:hypothetical protein CDD82_7832 [Ophiocordyceps australis]|uniref:Heterokaryon incompatibility domain-containing protein n=1 Tax=Ophiocordyceps australis TaxID=1399860 RepID=A0A2C5YKM3_9HYPO|nr:hypothetical protein CDD82_7832 [Ophiocordyceps australis]